LASNQSDIKDAMNEFCKAAGLFSVCLELSEKCGLSKETLVSRAMSAISLGYAQLALHAKSVLMNSSLVLRSKIAGGSYELLKNSPDVLKKFALLTYYCSTGLVNEEQIEYGNAIAAYKEALDVTDYSVVSERVLFHSGGQK